MVMKELKSKDDVFQFVLRLFHGPEDKSDFAQAEALAIARWATEVLETNRLPWSYSRQHRSRGGTVTAQNNRIANADRDMEVRRLKAAGMSNRAIGREIGISESSVGKVLKREGPINGGSINHLMA